MKNLCKFFKDNTKVIVKSDNIYIYKHRNTEKPSTESTQIENSNSSDNSGFYNIIC